MMNSSSARLEAYGPETVRTASALCFTAALLWATQQNLPLSSRRTPVICRTPVGRRVYLRERKAQ